MRARERLEDAIREEAVLQSEAEGLEVEARELARTVAEEPRLSESGRSVPGSSLAEIEEPIDLVDVFRRSEFCPDVARQAVAAGAGALWLQLGVVSAEARTIAEAAGLDYVEDECTAIVHRQIG